MSGTVDIMQITEQQLLEMELSEWMACVEDMKKLGIGVLATMQGHLEGIQTVDDIRYRYFRKCYVGQLVLLQADGEPIEQLQARLREFMEGTLDYYLAIFQEEAFSGEMELLPAEARAAVWLNSMFFREEGDVEGRCADLEACARCYPVIKKNLERLELYLRSI